MNSSGAKAVPAQRRWRKLCVCVAALSLGVSGQASPFKAFSRSKSQAVDFVRPDPVRVPQDLLLKEEGARKADAMAAFAQGALAEENADGDQALGAYRKVLDLEPGFTELAAKVAVELVRHKSYDQAINVLKDAIKASPADAGIPLLIAQIYWKYLKKAEPAVRYATQAFELDPASEVAFLTLFEIEARQPKKVEQLLARAVKDNNRDPHFWLQLVDIYSAALLNQDDPGANKADVEKVNALYKKAMEIESANRQSGAANSDMQAEVLLRVADYYGSSHQYKEAIPLYEQAIQLLQASPDAMLPSVEERLARCYRLAGRTKEAIASLKAMIASNPLRYESYELLAGIYEEEEDLDNALLNYQQTLLMKPDLPINYLRVADMLLKIRPSTPERVTKAVEVLKEARAKFPEIPQIAYSLAVALSQASLSQDSLAMFSECYNEAKASQPDMLNGAFYFAYGATAEQAGNLEQAEVMLKRSIEVDPENAAQACNYLGYMWADRGLRLEEAGKFIQRALESDPENGSFLDSLGWLYFKQANYPRALEELKKAVAIIKPEDSVVLEHLGDTWFNLGNKAEALAAWHKAMTAETSSPAGNEKKRIQEKIESAEKPAVPEH